MKLLLKSFLILLASITYLFSNNELKEDQKTKTSEYLCSYNKILDVEVLKEEVLQMNARLIKAYEQEDIATLQELLTPEHIHNNIFGSSLTKDQLLADINAGILNFEYYRNPEISLRFYGDNTICIGTGIIEAKAIRGDKCIEKKFRFTRVFIQKNGKWYEELFQNTIIQ